MDKRRKWLSIVLQEGLRLGVLSASDVLRHVTPAVLATDLPPNQVASLLQAGIVNRDFNPELVVMTLGPDTLAEHVPLPLMWRCLEDAAGQVIKEHPSRKRGAGLDSEMVQPGDVRPEDMPVIEVIEE